MLDALVFELDFAERPVTIKGEEYVLVELNGTGRDKYLNNVGGRLRVGPTGKPQGVKDFEGLQASLVSASLKKIEGGERKVVLLKTVQTWPAQVIEALHAAAKKLSALGDEKGEKKGDADEDDDQGND